MNANIEKLDKEFGDLVKGCATALEEKKVTGRRLNTCLLSLSSRIRDDHDEFLDEELKDVEGFVPIWKKLTKYWDFFNYELLEHVIYTFGDDSLNTDMKKYTCELRIFRKTARMCEFVENWPKRGAIPPEAEFKELVLKIDKDWDTFTLEDLENLREALTQKILQKNFLFLFKEATNSCVSITWYIPIDIAESLKRDLQNRSDPTELFKEYGVEKLTIDGEECYYSPLRQYANFLKTTYTSTEAPPSLGSVPLSNTPLNFSLATIGKEPISKKKADYFTEATLRGDIDDIRRKKTPISFTDVGKLPDNSRPKVVLIEGAPGVGKTTFSWEYCRSWARGELLKKVSLMRLLPLRDNKIRTATTLANLFYHSDPQLQRNIVQEVEHSQGEGVVIWLEGLDEFGKPLEEQSIFMQLIFGNVLPKATIFITSRPWASQLLLKKHRHRISQHVEILGSVKELVEAVAKARTPAAVGKQFMSYISQNPIIKAAMYTPVTSIMVLEVFNYSQTKKTKPPATMTELYTTFICKRLSDYLSHQPEYGSQQWAINRFTDLPPEVYSQFRELCSLAYEGTESNQIVFPYLPPELDTFGLIQEVHSLYFQETASSSYNFAHLTFQEYLAAVHLSELPSDVQAELIKRQYQLMSGELTTQALASVPQKQAPPTRMHLPQPSDTAVDSGHFQIVFRFLAGLTKMANVPTHVTNQMLQLEDKSTLFNWMFEVQDSERTATILGQGEKVIKSLPSWIPLDYYATGFCISHSHCDWKLDFSYYFDDDKMELFSRGCSTLPDDRYTGFISEANFSFGILSSKGIEHFTQLTQNALQKIRVLKLEDCQLDRKACDFLAIIIPTMISLEELDLVNNPLNSGGGAELIKALSGLPRLKSLGLYWTHIGQKDCECLSELLASSQKLTGLSLRDNKLSSTSVDHIISGLSRNCSLTYLDVSSSQFSEDNAVHLAAVLTDTPRVPSEAKGCKLQHLGLNRCNITPSGAGYIAESLRTNHTMKSLWMRKNPIGVDGAAAFAAMLLQNTCLETLHLLDNSIGEEGVEQLIKSLKSNNTLMELRLPLQYEEHGYTEIEELSEEHASAAIKVIQWC